MTWSEPCEFRRRREGRRGNGVKNLNGSEAIPVLSYHLAAAALFKDPLSQNKRYFLER